MIRKLTAILLLAALAAMGGCNVVAAVLHFFAPPENTGKTVGPEYKGLDGHSLAIVVFADQKVQYEYYLAREHISRAIAGQFASEPVRKRIKDLRVVDPARVLAYQEQHIGWEAMDKTELGRVLGADLVLYVTLVEFTTREPGSINLYRGIITAELNLYRTALPEREAKVWQSEDIRVVFPESTPSGVPAANDSDIRIRTVQLFADRVAKKFYRHREAAT